MPSDCPTCGLPGFPMVPGWAGCACGEVWAEPPATTQCPPPTPAQHMFNFNRPPIPARSYRPGDIIPGRKCPKCKNESIKFRGLDKASGKAKIGCKLCGGGYAEVDQHSLPDD